MTTIEQSLQTRAAELPGSLSPQLTVA